MLENTHFEPTVRIQRDRDNREVDTGPYGHVRHPGYAGFLLVILSTPALVLSWWAYAPAAALVAVLVVRTFLEERTLRDELPGYREYADRVRHRFVPGVW
jgi:protein-S-isoprenylcysteine O-methyltransferase Ste14